MLPRVEGMREPQARDSGSAPVCGARRPTSAPVAAPSAPAAPADGEPLVDRVDGLDRERLLPADDKRRRDLARRLDQPPESNGWAMYVAGLAHSIGTGKARSRRNAEIALVEAVSRWTADVAELLPDRMADLHTIVNYGLDHPRKLFNQNQ